jgi:hypothetical protein
MSSSGTFTANSWKTVTDKTGDNFWTKDDTHSISAVNNNITFEPSKTIQGKCLLAQKTFSPMEALSAIDSVNMEEEIKKQLIRQLAEEMMRSRCVEFTKQVDGMTGEYVFRARIFVTPDHQVQTLRQANVIK